MQSYKIQQDLNFNHKGPVDLDQSDATSYSKFN